MTEATLARHRRPAAPFATALLAMLTTALLILTVLGGLNVVIDAYGLIRPRTQASSLEVRRYVSALRAAETGIVYSEDDRLIKLELVRTSTADCVIIGSSHVMSFRRDSNPYVSQTCRALDNAGVSGGAMEDVVTLLGAAIGNPNIKHVFIGMDAWTFKRSTRSKWRRVIADFIAARRAFGLDLGPYDLLGSETYDETLAQAFSFRYFGVNWSAALRQLSGKGRALDPLIAKEQDLRAEKVLRSDGSLSYPEEFRPTPPDDAIVFSGEWVDPPCIEPGLPAEVQQMLQETLERGKAITLVQTPYHPMITHCAVPTLCRCIEQADPVIHRIAAALKLDVIGGFDPKAFGYAAGDFIDGQHLRGDRLGRLVVLP